MSSDASAIARKQCPLVLPAPQPLAQGVPHMLAQASGRGAMPMGARGAKGDEQSSHPPGGRCGATGDGGRRRVAAGGRRR